MYIFLNYFYFIVLYDIRIIAYTHIVVHQNLVVETCVSMHEVMGWLSAIDFFTKVTSGFWRKPAINYQNHTSLITLIVEKNHL